MLELLQRAPAALAPAQCEPLVRLALSFGVGARAASQLAALGAYRGALGETPAAAREPPQGCAGSRQAEGRARTGRPASTAFDRETVPWEDGGEDSDCSSDGDGEGGSTGGRAGARKKYEPRELGGAALKDPGGESEMPPVGLSGWRSPSQKSALRVYGHRL